jgi:hypothetical protein
MALETLLTARAALESARGTSLTPTRLVYFTDGSHSQDVATIRPSEKRASYIEAFRAYPGIERNGLQFSGPLTFEQAVWWANLHVKAVASGTGASADKTWTFNPTLTTAPLKSATIQFGYADSIGATRPVWEIPGCLGEELTITWPKDDTVRFASSLMTHKGATQLSAFTGSLTDVVTIDALGTGTVVYIDTTTIGTTADPNILDAEFTLTNGYVYLDTLNGTANATSLLRPSPRSWRLNVTRYYADDTELDLFLTKAVRKVRIKTTGPLIPTTAVNNTITLDLYGVWEVSDKAEVDGLGVAKMTLAPIYERHGPRDHQQPRHHHVARWTTLRRGRRSSPPSASTSGTCWRSARPSAAWRATPSPCAGRPCGS